MKNNIKYENIISDGKFIKTLNSKFSKFNNQADLYLFEKDYYILRTIGKQYDLSYRQLVKLEKDLNEYYIILEEHLDLKLSRTFVTFLEKESGVILLVTEYFPMGNITKVLSFNKKIKYLKIITTALIKLITAEKNINSNDQLICSIDTNPENFFINKKGEIVYNDFTPPLFREKNDIWFEFRRKDEKHVLKTEKEKRYFSSINLLLNFINKIRIYLSFIEYIKFVKWISKIIKIKNSTKNSLYIFAKIFEEISMTQTVETCYKFKDYSGARDLLRFCLSLNSKLSKKQIKEICKESKKSNGVLYLEKKIKHLNN